MSVITPYKCNQWVSAFGGSEGGDTGSTFGDHLTLFSDTEK